MELDGAAMACFAAQREAWAMHDYFRSPGPIQVGCDGRPLVCQQHSPPSNKPLLLQFHGHEVADVATMTLALEVNEGQPILLSSVA